MGFQVSFFSLGGGLLPLPRASCTALGRVA